MTAAEDREKRHAVDALVWRLKNRGDADDEPLAQEFIAALWGRGWRPTEAKPSPHWASYGNGSAPTEKFREALKQLHAKADGQMVQGEVIPDLPAIEAPQPKGGAP